MWGLRVAPAAVAAAVVLSHTGRPGDALVVAGSMLVTAHFLEPSRYLAHLMPLASFVVRTLVPLAGFALALAIALALRPIPLTAVYPALLSALGVLAIAAWLVARFERDVEVRIALVGSPRLARSLANEIKLTGIDGYRVIGWVDNGGERRRSGARRLGSLDEIAEVVESERIDLIVNAAGEDAVGTRAAPRVASALDVVEAVSAMLGGEVRLIGLNQFHEEVFGHVPLATLNAAFFQYLMHPRFRGGSDFTKRVGDLVVGGLAAVALAPFVAIAALAIKLSDGGPVFFRQVRVGAGGRDFEIVKLRTMRIDAEASGQAQWSSSDDQRITPVGRFLRRTHLDEVPQLINILRNEMSLVGPRPERPEIVARLEWQIPFYDRRELVKPGITGWAQVRCGYAGSEEGTAWKLCHDLYYLKHRSFALDAMIVLQTLVTAVYDARFSVRMPDEAFVLDAVRPQQGRG
jgi:exopolysaccharide biosynthesis polyprenyl glycosylphosphotransferase